MWRHRYRNRSERFSSRLCPMPTTTSSSMSVSTSQSCASPAGTAIAQCMRKTSVPLEVDDGDIVLLTQRHRRHATAEIHPEGGIARSPFPPSDSEPDLRRSGLSQPIWAPSSTCDHLCEGRVNVRPTDITRWPSGRTSLSNSEMPEAHRNWTHDREIFDIGQPSRIGQMGISRSGICCSNMARQALLSCRQAGRIFS